MGRKIFAKNWKLKEEYKGLGIKAGDYISTDHLSPGKRASSRTDKPLHATYIMDGRPIRLTLWRDLKV
jgi:aconitase B